MTSACLPGGQRADPPREVERLGAVQRGRAQHLGHGRRRVLVDRLGALEPDGSAYGVERVDRIIGTAVEPEAEPDPRRLEVRIAHDARCKPHVTERLVGHAGAERGELRDLGVGHVDGVGSVEVQAEVERAGGFEYPERIVHPLVRVLVEMEVELDAERLGDRRRDGRIARDSAGARGGGDLERAERVWIDERRLGRLDVRAVGRRADHGERVPEPGIVEGAQVAAHEGGIERVRPVDHGRHAGVDEARGAETDSGVGVGLAKQRRPERADAAPEPDEEVAIGRASADEGLPEVVVCIDETGHDDHPAAVDHPHPYQEVSQVPDGRNMVAADEDIGGLERSEPPPVAEVWIHGEDEGGVPNQIAAAVRACSPGSRSRPEPAATTPMTKPTNTPMCARLMSAPLPWCSRISGSTCLPQGSRASAVPQRSRRNSASLCWRARAKRGVRAHAPAGACPVGVSALFPRGGLWVRHSVAGFFSKTSYAKRRCQRA
jgi:hypothetical protein